MTRKIESFTRIHFYKAIIGANHYTMPLSQNNLPKDWPDYPSSNNASYQNWGDFLLIQKIRMPKQKI